MPAIQSIQTGSKTILAADGLTPTQTISAVTTANSIVMYTLRSDDNAFRYLRYWFKAVLTSSTQITFTRTDAAANTLILEWTVVEFASGALQNLITGTLDCTLQVNNITISSVATAQACVLLNASTTDFNEPPTPQASLSSSTNLRLDFTNYGLTPSAGEFFAAYSVIEFKSGDATVQAGSMSFTNGTPGTATITAVNLAKTFLAYSYVGGNSSGIRYYTRMDFNSTTQVGGQAQNFGTSVSIFANYFAVSMTDASTVEQGRVQIPASATVPTTQPTWSTTMTNGAVIASYPMNSAYNSTASDSFPNDAQASVSLGSPQNNVIVTRRGSGAINLETAWQVVQFAASGGGATLKLFIPSSLNGLGSGGAFFHDRLSQ